MAPNATMNRAMKNEIGPALPRPAFAVGLPGLRVRVVLVIDMKIPAAFDFTDAAGGKLCARYRPRGPGDHMYFLQALKAL